MPDVVNAPVLVTPDQQHLEFHIARANESWPGFSRGGRVKVLCNGPNAPISPSWYRDRFANGDRSRTAPTWDYVQAVVTGSLQKMDAEALADHLGRLTARFEGATPSGWKFQELDREMLRRWQKLIAGFTIQIETAEVIFKLSQEQQQADRRHIVEGLEQRGGPDDLTVARLILDGLNHG